MNSNENSHQEEINDGKEQQMISWFKLFQFSPLKYKIYLVVGILAAMISGCGMPLFIIFMSDLYSSFTPDTSAETTYDKTVDISIYYLYIGSGLWVFWYVYLAFFGMISEYTGMIFKVKYLESVLKQDISWFEDNNPQSLASKISKESLAIQNATGEKAANIIMALTMSCAGFVIAFTVGWKFSLLCLAFIPFLLIFFGTLVWVLSKGYKQQEKAFKASSTYAEQALANIKIVVAYGQENREEERFSKHLDQAKNTGIKFHFLSSLGYAFNTSGVLLIFAAALYFGGIFVMENVFNDNKGRDYTGGDTIAIFFGVMFGAFSLSIAAPNFKALTRGRQAGYCALETIHRQPEILIDDPEAKPLDDFRGELKFENVSFQYKTRKTKALNNVNITFERGKITALVGPSGSGKSTIVQLMERFYDPHEGLVLVDGQDLRTLNLRDFRSKVGYVGQEPVLFNQTIRENLLYGNPDATEEQIMKAITNANASQIIARLPEGLDTIVGAQGGQLSGGEKQRIALARAFVKNPKVLILDEATSALDRKNEEEVQAAIDRFENGDYNITTIVIAHRLSTIRNSDKIVVLKEGQVVEEGDHESLLKNYPEGVYAELVKSQNFDDNTKIEVPQEFSNDSLQKSSEELEFSESEGDSENIVESNSSDERQSTGSVHRTTSKSVQKQSTLQRSTMIKRGNTLLNMMTEKMDDADKLDEEIEAEKQKLLADIKKKGFFRRLLKYNKPYWLIAVGLISSIVQGMVYPAFGIFYIKTLFSIFKFDQGEIDFWVLMSVVTALVSFTATYIQKLAFGILSENMTKEIRKDLYRALLRKHIGWFDKSDNNSGVLSSVLSADVYALNGASTEGLSTIIETFSGLIGGIILSFIFDWRQALTALGVVPFFVCATTIQYKLQAGFSQSQDKGLKDANMLISDAISNYKTVASFAHEYLLVDTLRKKLYEPVKSGMIKSHLSGLVFGYSNFVQNAAFAAMFFVGASLVRFEGANNEDVFIAIFVVMFAAYGAGQAQQFGPSTSKAFKSALRIFSIIDEKSDVNIDDTKQDEIFADAETFNGQIEFKNIWFRYPTRKDIWVLKDFTLTIEPKEHIALVGESGSGKSTIVQLLYRFYEPHFGQIFINGIDIKRYNLVSLRQQMGLVQQMPTLFNESVLYNICYGQDEENLEEAIKASDVSNANGFIAKLNEKEKDQLIEEHEETQEVNIEDVKNGMYSNCGVGGSKLSGGQKQRIAIARAVIRQPRVLLLDEATSALDEVSQGKVQEALEQVMQGRTSIVIAHRLTTIENADRIVILKNGRIDKEGKFHELKDEL